MLPTTVLSNDSPIRYPANCLDTLEFLDVGLWFRLSHSIRLIDFTRTSVYLHSTVYTFLSDLSLGIYGVLHTWIWSSKFYANDIGNWDDGAALSTTEHYYSWRCRQRIEINWVDVSFLLEQLHFTLHTTQRFARLQISELIWQESSSTYLRIYRWATENGVST